RTRVCEAVRYTTGGAGNRQRRFSRGRTRRMGEGLCAGSALERCQGSARARLAAETSRSGKRDRRACLTFLATRGRRVRQRAACLCSAQRIFLKILERAKGLEPSTPTLARSCSTTELHPRPKALAAIHAPATRRAMPNAAR